MAPTKTLRTATFAAIDKWQALQPWQKGLTINELLFKADRLAREQPSEREAIAALEAAANMLRCIASDQP